MIVETQRHMGSWVSWAARGQCRSQWGQNVLVKNLPLSVGWFHVHLLFQHGNSCSTGKTVLPWTSVSVDWFPVYLLFKHDASCNNGTSFTLNIYICRLVSCLPSVQTRRLMQYRNKFYLEHPSMSTGFMSILPEQHFYLEHLSPSTGFTSTFCSYTAPHAVPEKKKEKKRKKKTVLPWTSLTSKLFSQRNQWKKII